MGFPLMICYKRQHDYQIIVRKRKWLKSMWEIILIILAIIIFIGIIRVIFTPSESFGDLICDIFLIDILSEALAGIIEIISGF